MTTTQTITEAVAHRTALVAQAEAATGRKASKLWAAVEEADTAVRFAAAEAERQVRAANQGATEAAIQTLARAAA